MKFACLAFAAFLLMSQSVSTRSEDRAKVYMIGTYLGDEMRPDGTNGTSSTLHRTYYVRTDDGTWSLVFFSGGDILSHVGLNSSRSKNAGPNLLDSLKHGDKFAFRAESEHRAGSTKTTYLVYVPRADDPKKEDKFDAEFTPIQAPATVPAAAPTDNVKAMCDSHRFTPEQEAKYCGN